jgi:hypothetical protein
MVNSAREKKMLSELRKTKQDSRRDMAKTQKQ